MLDSPVFWIALVTCIAILTTCIAIREAYWSGRYQREALHWYTSYAAEVYDHRMCDALNGDVRRQMVARIRELEGRLGIERQVASLDRQPFGTVISAGQDADGNPTAEVLVDPVSKEEA